MGRTTYWMNVSMDLCIEHAQGEQGGGSWMRIGEQLHREFNTRARRLALMVQGRVIYEIMEAFWPQAAGDASMPDFMREYGRIWTDAPKVLVSNSRREADYNTRIVGGPETVEQLVQLRRDTDGEIGVGGAAVATLLLQHGLLDELMLFVHPVILGSGRPLFDDRSKVVECDLIEHATFEDGVALQRYAVRR
ncbi:MAG TPA: dihydrofolate reductase family protein [Polyangiales bacterium]